KHEPRANRQKREAGGEIKTLPTCLTTMSSSSPAKSTRRPQAEDNGASVSTPAKTQSWMQTAMTLTGEALRQATWIGGAPSSDAISPVPMPSEPAATAAAAAATTTASGSREQ
ncbi:unnamed protein product, partial [Laminaria digitata]